MRIAFVFANELRYALSSFAATVGTATVGMSSHDVIKVLGSRAYPGRTRLIKPGAILYPAFTSLTKYKDRQDGRLLCTDYERIADGFSSGRSALSHLPSSRYRSQVP